MTARKPKHAKYLQCRHRDHLGLGNPAYQSGRLRRRRQAACSANIEAENQINAGFWWRVYQGKFGSFRFGTAVFLHPPDRLCAGTGGVKPTTDDSMVFTSIRYYPF